MYHKPQNSIRNLLVKPKDPTPIVKQCGVVYHIQCPECDQVYIGETSRPMGVRLKEHLKTDGSITSAIGEPIRETGHPIGVENIKVLGRDSDWHTRKVKEAIEIRTHKPALNRDGGYELAKIYNTFWSRDTTTNHVTEELQSVRSVE